MTESTVSSKTTELTVSLRTANQIQSELKALSDEIKVPVIHKITAFHDAENQATVFKEKVLKSITRKERLITALYKIRRQVQVANYSVGIDALLTRIAELQASINFVDTILKDSKNYIDNDFVVLRQRMAKSIDTSADRYYSDGNFDINTFTSADVETYTRMSRHFKLEKSKLKEELLVLNTRTDITMSGAVVEILQEENLI